jgi:hypothetical protein
VSRRHRGDSAVLGGGDADELLGAALLGVGDGEVVADEVEEGFAVGEGLGGEEGVAVAARRGLLNELKPRGVFAGGGGVGVAVAGVDDDGEFLHVRAEGFFDEDLERGFGQAVAINELLEGDGSLVFPGRGDDGLSDLHAGEYRGGGATRQPAKGVRRGVATERPWVRRK